MMDGLELAKEILATYERHGWKLRRVLLTAVTKDKFAGLRDVFGEVLQVDSEIDALWFARPSHEGREAWELRLISAQPYALFEAFEADESEEDRAEARLEMENRMRESARKT